MTDVFISYSRKDKNFVSTLYAAFERSQKNIWVDWKDIPHTSDWWAEIENGIESADTFVFVISPDSIASEVCAKEITHAVFHNKRLFPIVRRDATNFQVGNVAHEKIKQHNWLMFREEDDFEKSFKMLTETISLDLEHLHSHTRLLVKAIEWDKGRSDSLFLRGDDLASAERWLRDCEGKAPEPTELQKTYIKKSRDVEDASDRAAAILQKAAQEAQRKVHIGFAVLLFTLMAAGVTSLWTIKSVVDAKLDVELASVRLDIFDARFSFSNNFEIEGLLQTLRAKRHLDSLDRRAWENNGTQSLVKSVLHQLIYEIKERNRLEGHRRGIAIVTFSPDGNTIASASWDSTVKLWSFDGRNLQTLRHEDKVWNVAFSSNGKMIASASEDSTVKLWSLNGENLQTFRGHSKDVYGVAFSPDGETIASAGADGTVKLWSLDGKELQTFKGHHGNVWNLAFSPDGKTIASASEDSTVKLWSLDGKELQTFRGHSGKVYDVVFSPDGKTIASASADKTVKLWSLDGRELQTLSGHSQDVWSVKFSPDGKTIASASEDATVKLWSLDGRELQTFKGHNNSVYSVAFSPDGKTIASASKDKTVKLWNLDLVVLQTFKGHRDGVYKLAFSPDGKTIASASWDSNIKLWGLDGREIQTLKGHSDKIWSVVFSPDGKSIASASADKTIILWNLDIEDLMSKGCDWLHDYLITNSNATNADRQMCNIPPRQK